MSDFKFHSTPGGKFSGCIVAVRNSDRSLWIELNSVWRVKARVMETDTVVERTPRGVRVVMARASDYLKLLPDGEDAEVIKTFKDLARAYQAVL